MDNDSIIKEQSQATNKNSWKFLYSPIPKQIYRRMKVAKLSVNAIFVYLHIIDSLNGKTKTGWTIARTDEQVAESVGISCWCARTSRRELISHGFVSQKQYTMNDKRVVGTWTFKLNHTEPASKKTFDKYAKKAAKSSESASESPQESVENPITKVGQSPTQTCRESLQERVADPYTNPDSQPTGKSVIAQVLANEMTGGKDMYKDIHKDPPPISPLSVEKLSLAWNESHEYEEGEEEEFDKYFKKSIRATMDGYGVDEEVATAGLIRAFHKTKRNSVGHHPYDYPTAYTGDPDHEESKATPRGKKILRGAIHAVKSGESFSFHKPNSSSNDSTITDDLTVETVKRQGSDQGSAAPPPAQPVTPKQAEPQTPLATVRRNLAGRAAMLKAGIISPLSHDDVLAHAQSGLDAFDDNEIPTDDAILDVWSELVPDTEQTESVEQPESTEEPAPDAFTKLAEIQAKIVGLDEMRRSGTLSVDEIARVIQEIDDLMQKKAMLQMGDMSKPVVNSGMVSIGDVLGEIALRK